MRKRRPDPGFLNLTATCFWENFSDKVPVFCFGRKIYEKRREVSPKMRSLFLLCEELCNFSNRLPVKKYHGHCHVGLYPEERHAAA